MTNAAGPPPPPRRPLRVAGRRSEARNDDRRGPDIHTVGTSIIGQTALFTGLLYYFGWAKTAATLGYFGVDTSLVEFSTADYLLRSIGTALPPLILGGLALIGLWAAAHGLHFAFRSTSGTIRRAGRGAILAAAVLAILGGTYISVWGSRIIAAPIRPLVLAVGVFILIATCRFGVLGPQRTRIVATKSSLPPALMLLLVTVGISALVWSWSLYAQEVGVSGARKLRDELPYRTAISVYSSKPLAISGPGVNVSKLGSAGAYQVRYDGLTLLARASNGDLFLVPTQWQRGKAPVFQVPTSSDIRIDVVAPAK